MSQSTPTRPDYFYIELLRAVAAIAVVIIHVLGPYRDLLDVIPAFDWLSAVSLNVASRWAVPIFIMITGALMLSDTRPFNLRYFLARRVSKVLIPFLIWSIFYAFLAGATLHGTELTYDFAPVWPLLENLPSKATWYHLGFYYYFIPLYLLIPFLTPWVQKLSDDQLRMLVLGWLTLTLLYLLRVKSAWMIDAVMYGGYLVLGYALIRLPIAQEYRTALVFAAGMALLSSVYGIWEQSNITGQYTTGRLTSYKTLNTAVVAATVFMLAYYYGSAVTGRWKTLVRFIGRYSLGLYLLHPVVLWPIRQLNFAPEPALLTIPLMAGIVTTLTLLLVWIMSRFKATAWLVPA
ncbi:acyltransferase [Parendozoicomonas haliclonae]|uniref:Inner membrane protein YiaH n=1 Tax=Parendozoicomonas haliclonae TaxID=1960125 RepID=A0A1X7ALK7_9GAMM|nr:acyltransferase [Parendozoicomonas haliclonae]SMA48414.1 Inner membrane protein YiaH [Parendozoicomonas haliclonae]